jgi:hypothetical protein
MALDLRATTTNPMLHAYGLSLQSTPEEQLSDLIQNFNDAYQQANLTALNLIWNRLQRLENPDLNNGLFDGTLFNAHPLEENNDSFFPIDNSPFVLAAKNGKLPLVQTIWNWAEIIDNQIKLEMIKAAFCIAAIKQHSTISNEIWKYGNSLLAEDELKQMLTTYATETSDNENYLTLVKDALEAISTENRKIKLN